VAIAATFPLRNGRAHSERPNCPTDAPARLLIVAIRRVRRGTTSKMPSQLRRVQRHRGTNERRERLFVELVVLKEVDARLVLPSRLELKRPTVVERGAFGERDLDLVLYVSPVQIIRRGTTSEPSPLHSSTTSRAAA